MLPLVDKYSNVSFCEKPKEQPSSPEETNTSLESFSESEFKASASPPSVFTTKLNSHQWNVSISGKYIDTVAKATAYFLYPHKESWKQQGERDEGEKKAAIDYESMEEIEAGDDIQHVISFDRPAHASASWLEDLRRWGYYEISTPSPQLLPSFPGSLSIFLSPTNSHSPLLLSLLSFARSSLSPTQLYSSGIEMGLSLPAARRHRVRQYFSAAHVCAQTQAHQTASDVSKTAENKLARRNPLVSWLQPCVLGEARGFTISGSAPPLDRWRLLVLVVLVAVKYSILLHLGKSSSTLLVQVGVWWLRTLCSTDFRSRIFIWKISLVIPLAIKTGHHQRNAARARRMWPILRKYEKTNTMFYQNGICECH